MKFLLDKQQYTKWSREILVYSDLYENGNDNDVEERKGKSHVKRCREIARAARRKKGSS